MLCNVAFVGIGISIGTSILLYRIITHWLRRPPSLPPPNPAESVDNSVKSETSSVKTSDACTQDNVKHTSVTHDEIDVVSSHYVTGESLRNRKPFLVDTNECHTDRLLSSLNHPESGETVSSGSSLHAESQSRLINNNALGFSPLTDEQLGDSVDKLSEVTMPSLTDDWSFSTNDGLSQSHLQDSCAGKSFVGHETPQLSTVVRKTQSDRCSFRDGVHIVQPSCRDSPNLHGSFVSSSFSPDIVSCKHSTPDDQQTFESKLLRAEPTNLKSFFVVDNRCPMRSDDGDGNDDSGSVDEGIAARNTTSVHDWSNSGLHPVRHCVSLDDSIFLDNDMELITSPHPNEICSTVTNLEQLELEVAGVLSDCGEMERHVGALRRFDRRDKVAKRYSLGVADSVIAADVKILATGWQELSSVISNDSQSLSMALANGRDSGYIWDDDLFSGEFSRAMSHSMNTTRDRRATRSLSPPGRRHGNNRCSIESSVNGRAHIDITAIKAESISPPSIDEKCLSYSVSQE